MMIVYSPGFARPHRFSSAYMQSASQFITSNKWRYGVTASVWMVPGTVSAED